MLRNYYKFVNWVVERHDAQFLQTITYAKVFNAANRCPFLGVF